MGCIPADRSRQGQRYREVTVERQIDLNEVSDGRLYGLSRYGKSRLRRLCRLLCLLFGHGPVGGPGSPWICTRLAEGTGVGAKMLLTENLELNVVDGIVLPI